ncbi:MAG: hypothetical protein R6V85_10865 [Polyangia bacterium]
MSRCASQAPPFFFSGASLAMLAAGLIAAAGCGDRGPAGERGADRRQAVEQGSRPAADAAGAGGGARIDAGEPEPEPEPDPRLEQLRSLWERHRDVLIEHFAAGLSEDERLMLLELERAAEIVEEIYILQLDARGLERREQVAERGVEIERRLFERYRSASCGLEERRCDLLPDTQPSETSGVLWPDDISKKEIESLRSQINGRELLSPFTAVRRARRGRLRAVPYARVDELGEPLQRLAGALRRAAEHAPHASLGKFLRSRAAALTVSDPFPYDESDRLWIAVEGDWEVTVGPYETYRDPHGIKAIFEMVVGRRDAELTAEIESAAEELEEAERALLGSIEGDAGPRIGRGAKRPAIRAIEVWLASGDARRPSGAMLAYHLPNRGAAARDGLSKKVLLANHARAFDEAMQRRARLLIASEQVGHVDARARVACVAFHELAHGLGAGSETEIEVDGKRTTAGEALPGHFQLIEEIKADAVGLWLSYREAGEGEGGSEAFERRALSWLAQLLGLLVGPLEGTHARAAAVELGRYFDAGALVWEEGEGRLRVDFEKLPAAVEALAQEAVSIQLAGDRSRAEKLVERYLEERDGKIFLRGRPAEVRRAAVEKLGAAGIRPPSLRYEVSGLRDS